MTPIVTAMLCAFGFGFGAAYVLLPMAEEIPLRLERQWASELEAHAQATSDAPESTTHSYTLAHKAAIVVAAMLLGFVVITTYGSTTAGAAYSFYYFSLLLLVAINVKHMLLPDSVVLPTLWVGLLYHASTGGTADYVYGATAGYLVPFLIAFALKLVTRREFIGRGDLKSLAMAGAWFGMAALPTIAAAFVVGVIVWAIVMRLVSRKSRGLVPSGPAHLLASLAVTLGARAF